MSKRPPAPTARRTLRSNTKLDDEDLKKNPYSKLQRSLDESHERSVSPHHRTDDAETDDDDSYGLEPVNNSGVSSENQSFDSPHSTSSSPATPRSQFNTSGSSSKTTSPLKAEGLPPTATERNWTTIAIYTIGAIFIVLSLYLSLGSASTASVPSKTIKQCDGFHKLSTTFPKYHQDIFLSLKLGVEELLNKNPCHPSVFLFIHDGEIGSFIEQVLAVSVKCLQTADPILLSSEDFKNPEMTQDYGVALAKYKGPLEESSILVVYNLDDVPAIVAQAFHTICDTYNPLVEKAIILLTMKVTQSQINATEDANEIADKWLKQGWTGLAADKLEPLIARVTDQVFVLKS